VTHPFLDSPTPIAFAHRGGSLEDENGLLAFQAAERLGFRYIETDVRATRDGVAFVFHDEHLGRMTGCDREIADVSAADLGHLTLPKGDKIPTLRETLGNFPDMRFNLDLKDDAAVDPVVTLIEEMEAHHQVCVTSFSEGRVSAVRDQLGPAVCTGLGVSGALRVASASIASLNRHNWRRGAAVLQIPVRWKGIPILTSSLVRRAHEAGLAVHVWTLNDRGPIESALDKLVDGVMTDRPQLLKEILVARGLWKERALQ
jgi:glycerophosphoryl diester phosphodiesterase